MTEETEQVSPEPVEAQPQAATDPVEPPPVAVEAAPRRASDCRILWLFCVMITGQRRVDRTQARIFTVRSLDPIDQFFDKAMEISKACQAEHETEHECGQFISTCVSIFSLEVSA